MSFKIGIEYVRSDAETQADNRLTGKRSQWFATDAGSIEQAIDLFDSVEDNDEWSELVKESRGDMNQVIGARARIGWLAGCRADVRRQFASGANDAPRSHVQIRRYSCLQQKVRQYAAERLDDIVNVKRREPITGK